MCLTYPQKQTPRFPFGLKKRIPHSSEHAVHDPTPEGPGPGYSPGCIAIKVKSHFDLDASHARMSLPRKREKQRQASHGLG